MWAKILASVLLVQAVFAQEGADDQTETRRLRFRRPRPKLIDVDDPEGELQGSPIPVLIPEESAQVLAPLPQRSSGNAALDALIATAQKDDIVEVPAEAPAVQEPALPAVVDVQDIPLVQEAVTPLRAQRPAGNRRRVPGVPRRRRPRPERPVAADGEAAAEGPSAPRGRPRGGEQQEAVGTLERYSHKNDDGSFTFGYVGADGSFREETRGVDCITRGKYGYIDPDGVKREYTYTSGLPCEIGEDGQQLQNVDNGNEINVEDPVDPRERFRQTQNVQLAENEIPESAKRQRVRTQINRRPAVEAAEAPEQPAAAPIQQQPSAFTNFGNFNAANANPNRGQIPQRRPIPNRNGGDALTNLLNIADESVPAQAAPAIPQRIQPAAPAIPQRIPAGSFDFDSELEGFTLNRPSLTFEENRNNGEQPSTSFQSQLVFNQQTGTFQTQLQQNIPGSESINLQNAAAPFAVASTTTPAPAAIADNDFTLTTRVASPTPTIGTPAPASRPTQASNAGVVPAGTFKLDFEPLNIPAAAPLAPTQAPAATTFSLPPSPTQPATVRVPAPTPAAPQPAPARPQPGQNTFFVFQPFNQGGQPAPSPRPASDPFNTPLNPNAFRIIPGSQGAATQSPAPQAAPAGAPQPQQFFQPQQFQPQQFQPQAGAPAPVSLPVQRLPVPQAAAPQRPAAPPAFQPQPQAVAPAPQAAPAPQLQFGFQPVIQPQQGQPQGAPQLGQPQPPRNVPFTAFRTGTPPQLQAFANQQTIQGSPFQQPQQPFQPQQLSGAAPAGAPVRFIGGAAPAQLGVPPQLQQPAEQPRFAAPGGAARPAQFFPQGNNAFSVFNPTQLRGA